MKKLPILFLILVIFLPPFGFGQAAVSQTSSSSRGSSPNTSIAGSSRSNFGTVAGSALGGLMGNQIGGGFGRTLSIFIGTVGGGLLGNIIGGAMTGGGTSSGGGGGLTFGGMISVAIPCTCSPGIGLIVGPPKGGIFLLSPTSKLHANMKPIPGSWVLGDYSPGGICLQVGTPCFPFPVVQGTIGKIGTS